MGVRVRVGARGVEYRDEPADELVEGRAGGRLEDLAHDEHTPRRLAPLHVRAARERRRVAGPKHKHTDKHDCNECDANDCGARGYMHYAFISRSLRSIYDNDNGTARPSIEQGSG